MFFSVALVSSVQMRAQQPEGSLLFRTDDEQFTKINLVPYMAHRGVPLVGDFNGDGKMDIYQTGTSCYYGWNTKGAPFENMGEGKFVARGGFKWDAENPVIEYAYKYVMVPVYQKDDNGEVKTDEQGNPVPEVDEHNNPVILKDINGNDSITNIRYDLLGIEPEDVSNPGAAWNSGSVPIDFNQDGLLDYVVLNCGGENSGTKGEVYILKNLGEFKFEKFTCDAFMAVSDGEEWGYGGFNEKT